VILCENWFKALRGKDLGITHPPSPQRLRRDKSAFAAAATARQVRRRQGFGGKEGAKNFDRMDRMDRIWDRNRGTDQAAEGFILQIL
jgi:hypothetical protein